MISIAGAASGQSTLVLTGAAAYGDWRSEGPDHSGGIPRPCAKPSANRHPSILARPGGAPPSFAVELFASGLDNPRLIRVSPSGDIFVAGSRPGRILVLRATTNARTPAPSGRRRRRARSALLVGEDAGGTIWRVSYRGG